MVRTMIFLYLFQLLCRSPDLCEIRPGSKSEESRWAQKLDEQVCVDVSTCGLIAPMQAKGKR